MLLCHSILYYFRMLTLIFHLLSAHIWYGRCPCNDNRGMPLHFSSPLFFFFWILVDANDPLGVGEGLYRGGAACRPLLGFFLHNGRGKINNATGDRAPVAP